MRFHPSAQIDSLKEVAFPESLSSGVFGDFEVREVKHFCVLSLIYLPGHYLGFPEDLW